MSQSNDQEDKEKGRISFRIDNTIRETWKAKRKTRGFSNWKEYFEYLINNDKGDMMIDDSPMTQEELRTLKDINKTLLTQIQLLTEQLKNFDYLTQMNTLHKKINNHINLPKMQNLKLAILPIINNSKVPLTLLKLLENLNNPEITENDLLIALNDLVDQELITLNFHDQTYEKKGGH